MKCGNGRIAVDPADMQVFGVGDGDRTAAGIVGEAVDRNTVGRVFAGKVAGTIDVDRAAAIAAAIDRAAAARGRKLKARAVPIDHMVDLKAVETARHAARGMMRGSEQGLAVLERIGAIGDGVAVAGRRKGDPACEGEAVGDAVMSAFDPDVLVRPSVVIGAVMNEAAAVIAVFGGHVDHAVADHAETVEPGGVDPGIAGPGRHEGR